MRISDALAGVTHLGIDTTPLIYFIEQDPVRAPIIREIFHRVNQGDIEAFVSTISLMEVLVQPMRTGMNALEQDYRELLMNSQNLLLIPVGILIADRAADLRARYRFRTPDAVALATAMESGCQAFLTNDFQLRRATELRVLVIDDLAL